MSKSKTTKRVSVAQTIQDGPPSDQTNRPQWQGQESMKTQRGSHKRLWKDPKLVPEKPSTTSPYQRSLKERRERPHDQQGFKGGARVVVEMLDKAIVYTCDYKGFC